VSAPRPLWLAGHPVTTADVRSLHSPYDGREVSRVCWGDASHAAQALDAAQASAPALAAMTALERATILESARAGLLARRDELVDLLVAEVGKPRAAARVEVDRAADTLTDAAWAARSAPGTVEPLDAYGSGAGRVGLVKRVPRGLVTAITPFNFPVNLVLHKLAPAIAAGCPVILKPAPDAPSPALVLAEIFAAAGLPAGALSVLPLDVAHAAALTTDRRVKVLSFTGSAKVGWALKAAAVHATTLLELGGNAACYLAADADLDAAIPRLAAGAFTYAGQSCISVQRVLVHRSLWDTFVPRFVDHVRANVIAGDPDHAATMVGPVIRAHDAARLISWIDEAVAAGATLRCGGTRQGNVVAPTVLTDVPDDARLRCEEAFGPVVLLAPVDGDDDALTQIDASAYGLQAGLFTQDIGLLMKAWDRLHVGGIIHNDASAFRVDGMPYGGVRDSGIGREGPRHAMSEYTEPRLLVLRQA
jgi:acyl-CoA reductase-like NAD-dependent aldehyde dehydrogenase